MIRSLYSLLLWTVQPLLRRKLRRRGAAEPGYLEAVGERFGHYTPPDAPDVPDTPGRLWIHAVSLGETRAAAILLDALRARAPGVRILLTHGTATGRTEGAKLLREGDAQAWLPWDTPGAVSRFLSHFQPCAGVLMETEIWPNLAAACRAGGVPLMLANARLSPKSLRQARRLAWLSRPAYASLAAVWAQTQDDAARLRLAGARVTGITGNLKFDAAPDAQQLARGQGWRAGLRRPVVMFASSREGEEAALFGLLKTTGAPAASEVQWLVVPRHPQRFEEVAAMGAAAGLAVSRRSGWRDAPTEADLWIGDSLGEMPLYYGLADVALLGGSFAPLGGQNLIEAAACGCPVLLGPHTFNFADAAALAVDAGGAVRVPSLQAGVQQAMAMALDPARRAELSENAIRFAAAHRGAAAVTAQGVLSLLPAEAPTVIPAKAGIQ